MRKIYEELRGIMFEGIDDAYERREDIRKGYTELEYEERQVYKWYFFYQLCLLRNPLKRYMWEYICKEREEEELKEEYERFCTKREKTKRREEIEFAKKR